MEKDILPIMERPAFLLDYLTRSFNQGEEFSAKIQGNFVEISTKLRWRDQFVGT